MESLSRRAIHGALWVVARNLTGQFLGLVRVLVLARLLTPHDFGLFAVGFTLLALYGGFSGVGTQLTLIRRQDRAPEMFDTAWTLGLIRGGLGAAIQLALAPVMAAFYATPDALGIIRALALMPILRALDNIAVVEFRGDLVFRPQYVIASAGALAEVAVSVPLAIVLRSAWALVGGVLAAQVVRVLLSYLLHPYRPRFRLDRAQVRELAGYGRWILGTRVLTKLLNGGLPAVVGRVLGIEAVGLFGVASRWASLPASQVTVILTPVSVVAYAKLDPSPERLRSAYVRTLRLVALVATPLAACIVVYGVDLVEVVLGTQWRVAGSMVQVMGLYGFVRAVGNTTDPLFSGTGRPWVRTRVQAVELGLVAALFGALVAWGGIMGLAWTVTLAAVGAEGVAFVSAIRLLRLSAQELFDALAWPAGVCLLVAALRLGLPPSLNTPVPLAGALALSASAYGVAMLLLDRLRLYPLDPELHPKYWRSGVARLWEGTAGRRRRPRQGDGAS
ncbi:MAG TPA: lipopolysaccharide biosynthesis protein [Methylomirabilota bacterium]|jgi:PST family polysaccharide transporter/lipopolysaccharide exporter|nr:lipopolysaccharide biosynthesis protein [Methylomirabilota bacterium]